jgi:prepilin-type N-terminal cleavage/methylation domain-containing protein
MSRDRYAPMLVTSATNPKRGRRPFGAPVCRRWTAGVKSVRTTALGRLRAQHGFTLIEVLVAAALSLIVFAAVLSALEASQHAESRDQEWALVIQEGRSGLARMAREMRQAYSIRSDSHSAIDFYATIGGKSYEIRYDCAEKEAGTEYDSCVRKAAEFVSGKAPSSLPAKGETVVRYVTNQASACEAELLEATQKSKECVFQEYTPNAITPDLVTIKVRLPASGTLKLADALAYKHHIVLENGAYIRDMALGV